MATEITDRQKEIIDASLQLIAEGGIQGLTIKNIANKVGFTESAIYRHYENKIQILIAILNLFKEKSELFFANELQTNHNAITKIENLYLTHFMQFSITPSLVAVIFSEEIFRNETILVEKVQEIMKSTFSSLSTIIATGQKNNEIRADMPTITLCTVIMGSLRMFVKQWQMANYSFDLVTKGAEFINSMKILIGTNSK